MLTGYLVFEDLANLPKSREDQAKVRHDIRTSLLQLLGGIVLVVGAHYTAKSYALNQEGQVTERFTRAIDQLGGSQPEVCIGAIYGLERIARDSQRDHGPVMEVLTAYVREHARPPKPRESKVRAPKPRDPAGEEAAATERSGASRPEEDESQRQQPAADVQAALTVIARRSLAHERSPGRFALPLTRRRRTTSCLDLRGTDLSRADLPDAHLERIDFTGASLKGAYLPRAYAKETDFDNAQLGEARLLGAHLDGAKVPEFCRALLAGAIYDERTTWPTWEDKDLTPGKPASPWRKKEVSSQDYPEATGTCYLVVDR